MRQQIDMMVMQEGAPTFWQKEPCFSDLTRMDKDVVKEISSLVYFPMIPDMPKKDAVLYLRFLNKLWKNSDYLAAITLENIGRGVFYDTTKISGQEMVLSGSFIRAMYEDIHFVEAIVALERDNLLSTLSHGEKIAIAKVVTFNDEKGVWKHNYNTEGHPAISGQLSKQGIENLNNWGDWFKQYKPYNESRSYYGRDAIIGRGDNTFRGFIAKRKGCKDYQLAGNADSPEKLYKYVKAFSGGK